LVVTQKRSSEKQEGRPQWNKSMKGETSRENPAMVWRKLTDLA